MDVQCRLATQHHDRRRKVVLCWTSRPSLSSSCSHIPHHRQSAVQASPFIFCLFSESPCALATSFSVDMSSTSGAQAKTQPDTVRTPSGRANLTAAKFSKEDFREDNALPAKDRSSAGGSARLEEGDSTNEKRKETGWVGKGEKNGGVKASVKDSATSTGDVASEPLWKPSREQLKSESDALSEGNFEDSERSDDESDQYLSGSDDEDAEEEEDEPPIVGLFYRVGL
ncbi:hypothetical protein C8Q78DRAFT_596258 [Trametes maxima]|nr:hypothetical protein C8Q78DRAFT_596258 [Trametes maxima]